MLSSAKQAKFCISHSSQLSDVLDAGCIIIQLGWKPALDNNYKQMAGTTAQIEVVGLPRVVSTHFLVSFFERHGGGNVEKINYIPEEARVVVTFKEAEVANRLLQTRELNMENRRICITRPRSSRQPPEIAPQLPPKVAPKPADKKVPPKVAPKPADIKVPPKVVPKPSIRPHFLPDELSYSSSDDVDSSPTKNDSWWKTDSQSESSDSSRTQKPVHHCQGQDEVKYENTAAESVYRSAREPMNESVLLVHDQLVGQSAMSTPPVQQPVCRESFPLIPDKLKLLHKLKQTGNIETFSCELEFDFAQLAVVISGEKTMIMKVITHLYERVINFSTRAVKLSDGLMELILKSSDAIKRCDDSLHQFHRDAVVHENSSCLHVVAVNQSACDAAVKYLESMFDLQKMPVTSHHLEILQSDTWSRAVAGYVDKNVLTRVNLSAMELVIEGFKDDVKNTRDDVAQLISRHCRITRKMPVTEAQYKVLKRHESNILQFFNKQGWRVDFYDGTSSILVIGTFDEVEAAYKHLHKEYIEKIREKSISLELPGVKQSDFTQATQPGYLMMSTLQTDNRCVIIVSSESQTKFQKSESLPDVRHASRRSSRPSVPRSAAPSMTSPFTVVKGKIESRQVDAVVNVIADPNRVLSRASKVSKVLTSAAGEELEKEMKSKEWPQKFGSDVVTTSGYKLPSTKVYHAAVDKFKDQESYQKMESMIKLCLTMAARDEFTSIAFPTVGCGGLGYKPHDVARCFAKAQQATGVRLKIFIISANDEDVEKFNEILQISEPSMDSLLMESSEDNDIVGCDDVEEDHHSARPSFAKRSLRQNSSSVERQLVQVSGTVLIFQIYAVDQQTVNDVTDKLKEFLLELIVTDTINYDVITSRTKKKISDFQSTDIKVAIDENKKVVELTGKKSQVNKVKCEIVELLKNQSSLEEQARECKDNGDLLGYLRFLGSDETIQYPSFWGKSVSGAGVPNLLPSGDPLYQEVLKLVNDTFIGPQVGQGYDAGGLKHSKLEVQKIWLVENKILYQKYLIRKKQLLMNASVNGPPAKINGLKEEKEIVTKMICETADLKTLRHAVIPEINEYYLLHGTKPDYRDAIKVNGFDFRHGRDDLLFGRGIYFAECSRKADQHTDDKNTRPNIGQPLYMYVARVLLGNTYVCQKPKPFFKPPCTGASCESPTCLKHDHYDSVFGTYCPKGRRLLYRECVVYDQSQCYPEFLVEYVRR